MHLEAKQITAGDLKVGTVYYGKRRTVNPITDDTNDRIIVWLGCSTLQYDSDTVPLGQHLPRIEIEKFCKWAAGIVHEKQAGQLTNESL